MIELAKASPGSAQRTAAGRRQWALVTACLGMMVTFLTITSPVPSAPQTRTENSVPPLSGRDIPRKPLDGSRT